METTIKSAQILLQTLNADNLRTAVRFIQFLRSTQKESAQVSATNPFEQLQNLFEDDKGGYISEDDVVADLAKFRREHMKK